MPPPYTTDHITPRNWTEGGDNLKTPCTIPNRESDCPTGMIAISNGEACGTYCNRETCTLVGCTCWSEANKYTRNCGRDPATGPGTMCPSIGATTSSFVYSQGTGGTKGTAATNARIKCTYSTLPSDTALFSDTTMGIFTTGTRDTMRDDRCAQHNFSALKADTATCKTHYTSKESYDLELFKRIVSEGPSWIYNTAKREHVMTCITGSSVSLANDAANLLIHRIQGTNIQGQTYAGVTVTQPTDLEDTWGQYSEIVGFLNQLLRTSSEARDKVVPASIQTMVILAINTYCTSNPTHSSCSCVNATKQEANGPDPLTRCSTTDAALPGCDELKYLNDAFASVTSPNLAPFVLNVKAAFKPRCYASTCVSADLAGNQSVLRPDVYQAAACNSNLNVCFASIRAGGNISGDINLQQDCAAGTNQTIPSQLTSTQDRSGETVTVSSPTATGGGTPTTTSGPSRNGCVNGTCNEGGVTFNESDLIIKRGKSEFVDKYLQTPNKQKGAIGGILFCLFCCCCLLLLLMMSG